VNLDYFPLGEGSNTPRTQTSSTTIVPAKQHNEAHPHTLLAESAWEQLLTNIDLTDCNSNNTPPDNANGEYHNDWNLSDQDTDTWPISVVDLSLSSKGSNTVPQSVLSFSEESQASAEDLVFSACGSNNGSTASSAATAMDSLESSLISSAPGDLGNDHDHGHADADGFRGIAIPLDDDFDFRQ